MNKKDEKRTMLGMNCTQLLNDTLTLVQLARETARAQGKKEQFERFSPLMEDLKKVAATAQESAGGKSSEETAAQKDFRTLLSLIDTNGEITGAGQGASPVERHKVILAMAAGGMQDVDIARQMSMTRDEVQMLLQINLKKNRWKGVKND